MRHAFTLIELMIVIAIIAIIAAIAIPNLLESRVTSQEAANATALKSGILPGQVQYQAGAYSDMDNNGIGTYCVTGATGVTNFPYSTLCGTDTVNGITLNLLAPAYSGSTPSISGYKFQQPKTQTPPSSSNSGANSLDGSGEKTWGVICYPSDNNQGRRYFGINQAGNIYSSKPSNTADTTGASDSVTVMFGVNLTSAPSSATYLPYRK